MSPTPHELEQETLANLWREQPSSPMPSAEEVREQATRWQRRVTFRDLLEMVVAVGLLVPMGMVSFSGEPGLKTLTGQLGFVGVLFILCGFVWARGHSRLLLSPASDPVAQRVVLIEGLRFQQRLLERVWLWYVGPLVPCFVASTVMVAELEIPRGTPMAWLHLLLHGSAMLATCIGVTLLNWRAARKIGEQVDLLEGRKKT